MILANGYKVTRCIIAHVISPENTDLRMLCHKYLNQYGWSWLLQNVRNMQLAFIRRKDMQDNERPSIDMLAAAANATTNPNLRP